MKIPIGKNLPMTDLAAAGGPKSESSGGIYRLELSP